MFAVYDTVGAKNSHVVHGKWKGVPIKAALFVRDSCARKTEAGSSLLIFSRVWIAVYPVLVQ